MTGYGPGSNADDPPPATDAPAAPQRLVCVVCLFVRHGGAPDAVTVLDGYAVCDEHVTYVAGASGWHSILTTARREEAAR